MNSTANNSTNTGVIQDDGGVGAFTAALVLNGAYSAFALSIFIIFWKRKPAVYSPTLLRRKKGDVSVPPPRIEPNQWWIKHLFSITDEAFCEAGGPDAFLFYQFLQWSFVVTLFASFLGVTIILPINKTASDMGVGFQILSMANIHYSSNRFWAHAIIQWVISAFVLFRLHALHLTYRRMRHHYLMSARPAVVFVQTPSSVDVSGGRCAVHDTVLQFVRKTVGDEAAKVCVVVESKKLQRLLKERNNTLHELERVLARYTLNGGKPIYTRSGWNGWFGDKVNAIDFLDKKLTEMSSRVRLFQQMAKPIPAAVVVFSSMSYALIASEVNLSVGEGRGTVMILHPKQIYWEALSIPAKQLLIRDVIVFAFMCFLVTVWTIPVTFVASLTTLEELVSILPFLKGVEYLPPAILSVIEGFVPSLALRIFFILLPEFCRQATIFQGKLTREELNTSMSLKLLVFWIVNMFFVSLLGPGVLASLQQIIDSPLSIFPTLGKSVPATSVFFLNYTMLAAVGNFSNELAQLGQLIIQSFMKAFVCKTVREVEKLERPRKFPFATAVPENLLILLIGMTFAVVQPIVCVFVCLYFALGMTVMKRQLLYVYRPAFDSGGRLWAHLAVCIIVVLVISQLCVIAVILLNASIHPLIVMAPLPLVTIGVHFMSRRVMDNANTLPLQLAVEAPPINTEEEYKRWICPLLAAKPDVTPQVEPFSPLTHSDSMEMFETECDSGVAVCIEMSSRRRSSSQTEV